MKKYISLAILSVSLLGLSSCLKNKNLVLDPDKSPSVVEFSTITDNPSGSGGGYTLYARAFDIDPAGVPSQFAVNYSGPSNAPSDITVNLDVDPAAIDAYNDANGTSYSLMPASVYTLPSSVTIKSGERKAVIDVTFKTANFDLNESYILPLRIASVSSGNISSNYGTILVAVNAKNKYDGIWTSTGTMVDNTTASLTGFYPYDYQMITQSATAIAAFDPVYFGTYIHMIKSGGNVSGYGSFSPVFTFDDSGKITSVVNIYGQPAGNGRSAAIDPTGENKITSGTPGTPGCVFKVKYFLLQPGTTIRTTFNETWTYQGPRD
ncbi:DUF1735 domain-containing protein [Mucilaginibacter segetis]|uniref:DUF1735 domain-containing protein n=1 Tax=Mucilaginibacter segetis TaxID=2793071 RepID=A0A934PVM1_9SPHI|nr:DUF1735 domain-containing protein [Mucilaginibacter segetis]MBK0379916.1 DUF1735 domain-containing protein [Mucilaginibacter segetis]